MKKRKILKNKWYDYCLLQKLVQYHPANITTTACGRKNLSTVA